MKYKFVVLFLFLNILFSCESRNKTDKNSDITVRDKKLSEPNGETAGEIIPVLRGCGYDYNSTPKNLKIYLPRARELNQIENILKFSGLSQNFRIYSASIENAFATIIDDTRYILYDPKLLDNVDKESNTYWASMSILAHEVGHHLSGHTITNLGSNPKFELEADKYSGFVLYKMGASLTETIAAMSRFGSEHNSDTHPARSLRIAAITEGWNEANGTRYNSAIPPPPDDDVDGYLTYDYKMLFEADNIGIGVYTESEIANYDFFQGVVVDVELINKQVNSIQIYVTSTGSDWKNSVGSLDGETISVTLDDYWKSPDICMTCGRNLPSLLVPGRRIKFAYVEGLLGGSGEAGWLRLSYVKGLNNN